MTAKRSLTAATGILGAALSLTAGVALADVTTEQHISVEGTGLMSAANATGTTKVAISGNRSRTDTDLQLQSRLVRMLARNAVGPTAEIVKLDAGTIDRLELTRKQYTQTTFEQLRAHEQAALEKASQSQSEPTPKPMDDSKCEWLEPKASVKRTGEKATIAGYEAERLTITASQPCKDRETGAICEVALSVDEWLAPKLAISPEVEKFHKAYAQKIGLESSWTPAANQRAQAMFSRYKGIWSQITGQIRDVKGYPVRSSFAFAVGGEQCKSNSAQHSGSGDSSNTASDGGHGGDSIPTSPGALAAQIGGKLGSLLHRKSDASNEAQASAQPGSAAASATTTPALPPGLVPLVTVSSELVSYSTDAVRADLFEVPADFKKVER